MKVVAVHNFKGGVGKTTASVSLAFEAARGGERALLWDLDPQGAASYCLRVAPQLDVKGKRLLRDHGALQAAVRASDHEGLDLLPADFSLRHLDAWLERRGDPSRLLRGAAQELGLDHDWVVVDCAPTLSALNESVFAAASAVLVPTIPTVLSLRTVARLLAHLKPLRRAGLRVLPFLSMVDRRKALHRDVSAWVRAQGLGFLATEVPFASVVERASVERRPLGAFAPTSPAARAFAALLAEVRGRLEDGQGAAAGARPREIRELVEGLQRRGPLRGGPGPDRPRAPRGGTPRPENSENI